MFKHLLHLSRNLFQIWEGSPFLAQSKSVGISQVSLQFRNMKGVNYGLGGHLFFPFSWNELQRHVHLGRFSLSFRYFEMGLTTRFWGGVKTCSLLMANRYSVIFYVLLIRYCYGTLPLRNVEAFLQTVNFTGLASAAGEGRSLGHFFKGVHCKLSPWVTSLRANRESGRSTIFESDQVSSEVKVA